jgi:two-component system cell cycle response regulator
MSARILVVDDMLPSLKMLAAKLSAEYYEVHTASDGPSALEAVQRVDPDLVLLDVMMPGMDGFEVCRRIKADPSTTHIPVIMVTALSGTNDRVQGLDSGADDFLTKPVMDATLFARARSLIRLKRMLDQWRLREETTQSLGLSLDAGGDPGRGDHARIVLVGSSAIEAGNIRKTLDTDGDEVTVVEPSTEIAETIALADPDVIIIALEGDRGESLRLASQVRSHEPTRQTPVLLLGDDDDSDRLIKALELGINDYVLRPIEEHELIARVRTQVKRKRYQDRLRSSFLHSLSLALTDSLTGLHNRRYLQVHLDAILKRMAAAGKPVCLLMIDIDFFKAVNDTHGHPAGDEILVEMAQRIGRNVRGFDLAARYGGEEFVVVMPDTALDVAVAVADRLRARVQDEPFACKNLAAPLSLTISIGVAQTENGSTDSDALVRAADKALYEAKHGGRNQVVPKPGAAVPAAETSLT